MTRHGQQVIVKDRIFHRCPECKRYIGHVRCRWCGRKLRRPHELFKHESHCFGNPDGTCLYHGNRWGDCEDSRVCRTEGLGEDCRRWQFTNALHPTGREDHIDNEAYEWHERDRLAILREIDETTVRGDTP